MTQGENIAGMRSEFVHSTIGIITYKTCSDTNSTDLLNELSAIHRLAKLPNKSNYLIERTKLEATDSIIKQKYNNRILIIEPDEAMTLLLSTVLNIQGYETKITNDFKNIDIDFIPAVIILDEGNNNNRNGLNICKLIKDSHIYKNSKLVVTSIFHDKETILKAGADLYLPKPYDITMLVKWVDNFVKEVNF